ncbi:MAG: hypothetical protein QM484_03445 [Woeseiaceae bacterium]
MQFKNLLLLLSALFVFACSSTKPPVVEAVKDDRVEFAQKGFLLSVPESEGWSVVKKSGYKLLLSRRGARGNDGYTIQALVVSLPAFESDEQFQAYIEDRLAQHSGNIAEQKASIYTSATNACIQTSSKQDRNSNTGNTLTLETISFTCRHPSIPDAGVYLALSKSYVPESSTEDMNEQAITLFNNLYFTDL